MNTEKKKLNFESALKRLEKIVNSLENEEISIETSMKLFQEGKQLSNFCLQKLNEYEKKIKILIEKGDSSFVLKDFSQEEENNWDNEITNNRKR